MNEILVRRAVVGDAQAIAHLHVKVWRDTYQDLAPAQAYAVLDEAYRTKRWQERLSATGDDHITLIAEIDGHIAGIGAAGAPSVSIFGGRGEMKFLYIDPAYKRRGIARRLLRELALYLRQAKYPGVALSVVDGNHSALAFYEALGGSRAGAYTDPGPIWRSHNIVLVWDDIEDLLR